MAREKTAVCACGATCWPRPDDTPPRCRACWAARGRTTERKRDYSARARFVCPVCGGPKWSDGDRACRKCDHIGDRQPRACEVCLVIYKPTHSEQRSCGRICGAQIAGRTRTTCDVEWSSCSVCLRPWTVGGLLGFETCSPACREEARRILFPPRPVKDMSWQEREIECPMCGTVFTNPHTTIAIHCSKRCSRKAIKLRRRVREAQSYGEWRWSDFMRIARKFNYCCAYCGVKPERLDPDHVIPLSKGGPNIIGNLLPTCSDCNSDKQAYTLDEWTLRLAARGRQRHTSWAPEDKRYWHLTVLASTESAVA